jgi:hypothetical protein
MKSFLMDLNMFPEEMLLGDGYENGEDGGDPF